jgi:hypothetical protein
VESLAAAEEKADEDPHYWERVLKGSYDAHVDTVHKEQEAYARTLGKGKRVRKQVNYYEQHMVGGACLIDSCLFH